MTFKTILVALDGSKNSQMASEYAFWLASNLEADLTCQHVVDPRLVDLFIEPEFAEELGLDISVETTEKVFMALRKIGKVILERFNAQAKGRGFDVTTRLSEGYIVEEICKYADNFDLLVMGHRGQGEPKMPSTTLLGSVAERVVVSASLPVLIAVQPLSEIKQILVAYDGSEAARGALLMAENLAKYWGIKLQAMTVIGNKEQQAEAKLLAEQGARFLREYWDEEVFAVKEGSVGSTLLDSARETKSLLVLGTYGFREPDSNVLGSTTTKVIREATSSVLVYRPHTVKEKKGANHARVREDKRH